MLEELRGLFLSVPAMAFLGLVVGSFLNVVVYRLPIMVARTRVSECVATLDDSELRVRASAEAAAPPSYELARLARVADAWHQSLPALDLNKPHSHCPRCGYEIRWYENLPLVSWLWLRGRCSSCRTAIPFRYPLMEALTGVAFAVIGWRLGPSVAAVALAGFAAAVLAASVIDLETGSAPAAITQPLLWLGLLAASFGHTVPPSAAIVGAAVGYASLWCVGAVASALLRLDLLSRGHFVLLAAVGAWMGWHFLLPVLVLGVTAAGAAFAAGPLERRPDARVAPLGPCVGFAAVGLAVVGPVWPASWF